MKVSLINHTGMGQSPLFAAALLIFTKNTRLEMDANGINQIMAMPESEIYKELEYMSNTIPSSWEFVDYTFVIEGVTRAYTHQAVRTRAGSYAQQTMRVLDVSGFDYLTGPSIEKNDDLKAVYDEHMYQTNDIYSWLIENGAEIQDARGVLPTNIKTNIVAKFNLRTMAELAIKRSSPRVQGEYRDALEAMFDCVLTAHPWAELFLRNKKIDAAKKLDDFINRAMGQMELAPDEGIDMLKAVDLLRQ